MKNKILFFIITCLYLINVITNTRQFTATDLHKMKRLSSPAISLDNNFVVFTVKIWDEKSGKVSSQIKFTNILSGRTLNLTAISPGQIDNGPLFNKEFPDLIFFISNRNGTAQIYYQKFPPQFDGEPVQLTNYPLGVSSVKFQANSIVFAAEVYFDCLEDVLGCTAKRDAEVAARGSNTWGVYTKLFVRHWDRYYTEGKGNHLILQKITKEKRDEDIIPKLDQEPIDLLKGMEANSPIPPFGGLDMFDVHPNGDEIVFTAHLRNHDESWDTGYKTYVMNVNTMTSPFHLTQHIKARTQNPTYSPDGTKISYLTMKRIGLESDNLHIEVYDTLTNSIQKVTDFIDNSVNDYIWYDGNTILYTIVDINKKNLYKVNLKNLNVTRLTDDTYSYNSPLILDYSKGLLISLRTAWTTPDELVIIEYNDKLNTVSNIKRLINPNEDNLKNFNLDDMESFLFTGGYNDQVQGWIQKPSNFEAGKKYPLAFMIHGGPESAWKASWSYSWNPQVWAQRGYVVVMINPHGSTGQGIRFQDACRDDWGGIPYQDLMTGLDYVLKTYNFIDENRMCAAGASYGGYMVNWLQGKTDRFKCFVTHAGKFSTVSGFYGTDEIWFPYSSFCPRSNVGCTPFDEKFRDHYLRYSPESFAQNWKTPHLITHGSLDYRIPISEGLSSFTLLQVKGIKSKMLHFNLEGHGIYKSENSIKWYSEVIDWMDQFTKVEEESLFLKESYGDQIKYLEK